VGSPLPQPGVMGEYIQNLPPSESPIQDWVVILNKGCGTLKTILRQKKNYGNSNISPCKNIIFKKYPLKKKNPKILQDIITL
jgi:hypothetical protein